MDQSKNKEISDLILNVSGTVDAIREDVSAVRKDQRSLRSQINKVLVEQGRVSEWRVSVDRDTSQLWRRTANQEKELSELSSKIIDKIGHDEFERRLGPLEKFYFKAIAGASIIIGIIALAASEIKRWMFGQG